MKRILFSIFLIAMALFLFTACDNINPSNEPAEEDLTKILETFKIENVTLEEDGQPHTITVTGTYEGYEVKAKGTVSYTEAGTYTITYVVTKTGSDEVLKTLTATLTITEKDTTQEDIADVKLSDATIDYDGKAHTLEVTGLKEGYEAQPVGEVSFTELGAHEVKYNIVKTGSTEVLKTVTATLTIYDDGLERAVEFVATMQRQTKEATGAKYDLIAKAVIDGQDYPIEWSIKLENEADAGKVTVAKAEDNSKWTVEVDEESLTQVNYKLVAKVTSANGHESSVEFDHYVPAYKLTTYAEWKKACEDKSEANLAVKGYVIAVILEGSSKGSIYFQDADGYGYYAYKPANTSEVTFELGEEIVVKGTGTVYGGQYEFNEKCTVSKTGEKITLAEMKVNDGTEAWSAAADNKDKALIPFQNALIKLEGCTMDTVDGLYYYFTIGEQKVRYNLYNTNYFLKEEVRKSNYVDVWGAGKTFDIIGLVSCYSESYQVYPVFAETISNIGLPIKTDAEAVEIVKAALSLSQLKFEENGELPLQIKGYGEQVTISWESDNAAVVVEGAKAKVTLTDTELKVKLTATLTAGEATDTKEFELELKAAANDLYVPVVAKFAAGTYYFAYYQAKLEKYLYFAGGMNGNYLASTDKAQNAMPVTVAAVEGQEGKYTLSYKDGEADKYIEIYEYTSGKFGVHLVDEAPTNLFSYDETLGLLVTIIGDKTFYLGTFNTNQNFSASNTSYITGNNAANLGVTQFPAIYGFMTFK